MQVRISSLMSADGVREAPMDWIGDLFDPDAVDASIAQLTRADAFLMGRGAHDYFAPHWARGGNPYLDMIAAMPKYVFSATLERTGWPNTTIVRTDAVAAVRDLPGTGVLYGMTRLARALLAAGLVEEVTFGVQPVLAGDGRVPLRLATLEQSGTGALTVRYTPGD